MSTIDYPAGYMEATTSEEVPEMLDQLLDQLQTLEVSLRNLRALEDELPADLRPQVRAQRREIENEILWRRVELREIADSTQAQSA